MKKLLCFSLLLVACFASAQHSERVQKRLKKDSLYFAQPFPYILPIYGPQAHERGYKPELPFGVMLNILQVQQTLYPDNYSIGFGNIHSNPEPEIINIESIASFEHLQSESLTTNIRIDVWPLPFLNLYGIVGKLQKANVLVHLTEPFDFQIPTTVEGWYLGAGMLLAAKVGPLFFSLDSNTNYNHNPKVEKPIMINITGLRIGPVFNFKNNPNMNVVLWAGVMHTTIGSSTKGRVLTNSFLPDASEHIDKMNQQLNEWYDNLNSVQQILYSPLYNKLQEGIMLLSDNIEDTFIDYEMDKTSARPWNLILGAQWKINQKVQFRTEAQLLGDRIAGMLSLSYRFGIKRKQ